MFSDGEISPQVCIGLGLPDCSKHSLVLPVRHFVAAGGRQAFFCYGTEAMAVSPSGVSLAAASCTAQNPSTAVLAW